VTRCRVGSTVEWQQAVQSQELDVTHHDDAMQQLPLSTETTGAEAGGDCGFKSCAVCIQVKSTRQYRTVNSSPDGFAIACRACEEVRTAHYSFCRLPACNVSACTVSACAISTCVVSWTGFEALDIGIDYHSIVFKHSICNGPGVGRLSLEVI
jgi:hypothetical protein